MSHSTLLFDLLTCALCDLPSSVVVMYMCIMVAAISMQVLISCMAEVLSSPLMLIMCCCECRGMLSTPMKGDSGGVQDPEAAGRSTGDAARRASGGRVAVPGAGCEAGASRANAVASAGGGSTAAIGDSESD